MHAFSPLFVDRKCSFESLPTFKHLFSNNAIPCVPNSRNRKIGTRASQRRVDEKSGLPQSAFDPRKKSNISSRDEEEEEETPSYTGKVYRT